MKINVTKAEWEGHDAAVMRGAAEGFVGAAAVATPLFFYLHRKWPYYRSLPCLSKSGAGKLELDRAASEEEARWNALATGDKIGDWAYRHQYSIILGSWALSMAIAGAIVAKNKYQTLPQKAVQARMWAQGLTIGVLLAAGALTHKNRQDAAASGMRRSPTDHSWKTFLSPTLLTYVQTQLDQQEREQEERKAQLATLQPSPSS
ncbi:hypothetical protein BU15DRAFT_87772 [Melanogaster broomeanus]|nr:hypothetical protein BU15DRAFT_87772 [Melanogaster broomeanus]